MADGLSPTSKVKFLDDDKEKQTHAKHVPTQRYDRREIQKRLDIENWMDEQLNKLYQSEEYPQLDIDDVQKIEETERKGKLQAYLSGAKIPVDDFINELLSKVKDIKPVTSTS